MDNSKNTNKFGLPVVDSTPMGQIEMQGQLYRAMANRRPKSLPARLGIIIAAFFLLVLPSVIFSYIYFTTTLTQDHNTTEYISLSLPFIFLLLMLAVGLRIINNNIK